MEKSTTTSPVKYLIIAAFIILLIWVGVKYAAYKRFVPIDKYNYQISEQIDVHYHNQTLVQQYYNNVYRLSSFANEQWYNYEIDVMHPDHENAQSILANETYLKLLGNTTYLEGLLRKSSELKKQGANNETIKIIEQTGQSIEAYNRSQLYSATEYSEGDKGEAIKTIQKRLNQLGYEIPETGLFSTLTFEAITEFQLKNELLPTGVIDQQTLQILLN